MLLPATLDSADSLEIFVLLKDVVNLGSSFCSLDCSDFFPYLFAEPASFGSVVAVRCTSLLYEVV